MMAIPEATRETIGPLGGLTEAQVKALEECLDSAVVKTRKKGGTPLSYIEGHHVIREANRIFGFANWRRETKDMRLVTEREYTSKDSSGKARSGYLVAYVARVMVAVRTEDGWIGSDGWGYGEGIDYTNIGQAHESAVKEAETDAMKRAMIKWGDPFGLALYDKAKEHVDDAGGNGNPKGSIEAVPREDAGNRTFANPGELYSALAALGYKTSADRKALAERVGIESTWSEMGPAGYARIYEAAVKEAHSYWRSTSLR